MKSINTVRFSLLFLLWPIYVLSGCGSAMKPKTSGDVKPAEEIKPKRKVAISAASKFKKLVAQYRELLKKRNLLTTKHCQSLAERFGSMADDNPELVEARFNQGVILLGCGLVDESMLVFEQLLKVDPHYGPALNNLGVAATLTGAKSRGTELFSEAASKKDSWGYANLALQDREKARRGSVSSIKLAIDNVHRALAVDSSNVGAYEILSAVIYDHAKTKAQLEIARLVLIQAQKIDQNHAPLYNLQGLILLKMREVTRALRQFREAVRIDPSLVEAQMNIGAITLNFRDFKSAEAAFSNVLASRKASPEMKIEARIGLGVAFRGQRKFKEALDQYRKAQQLDPKNPGIYYNIGVLIQDHQFNSENPDLAIASLQQAQSHLLTYAKSGHRLRARDCQRRLKNISQMIPALREQKAMMAEMKKMQEEAERLKRQAEAKKRRQKKAGKAAARPKGAANKGPRARTKKKGKKGP